MSSAGVGSVIGSLFSATPYVGKHKGWTITAASLVFPALLLLFAFMKELRGIRPRPRSPSGSPTSCRTRRRIPSSRNIVPDHLRGRVMGLYVSLLLGLMRVGSLLMGMLAEVTSTPDGAGGVRRRGDGRRPVGPPAVPGAAGVGVRQSRLNAPFRHPSRNPPRPGPGRSAAARAADAWSFAFTSDSHNDKTGVFARILAAVDNSDMEFLVHGGDMVNRNSREEWGRFLRATARFRKPLYPVIGNHERDGKDARERFAERFGLPGPPTPSPTGTPA